ncbi:MAG: Type pilus assembly protein PilM [Verrucomicrobiales bacterium]|nr:Type pilus assembly protein PilM [Verrucomicrobiales bacterium]
MALPFLKSGTKKRELIVAIDLGSRTTKAVYLQRKGETLNLLRYAILDAPIYDKSLSPDLLSEHLKSVMQALDAKTKHITLAVGVADSLLRTTELPPMPIPEMRLMLKYNSKNYLQQDLPDHVFDAYMVPPKQINPDPKAQPKYKVWVGGAKNRVINDILTATRAATVIPDEVTLSIVGPVNAFEFAEPETFRTGVAALVDVGFKNSTINIISEGELMLSRVVGIGGDKLTTGLAEAMSVTYAEAEGIKIGMPTEVESALLPLISPLGRELRASIDFFEHQQDKQVGQVYLSGGAANSQFMTQALQSELMVNCKSWNPTSFLRSTLPPQQASELDQIAPQLAVCIGTAAISF